MIVRIYTGEDGRSHFQDLPFPEEGAERIATKPGEDLVFRNFEENRFSDWHHPARRQILFIVGGRMEVSVGDGSVRQFQAGDVVVAEDMTGQGHVTKGVDGPYRYVSMGLPDLPLE